MQLEGGNSVHMIDAFFDALGQGECLMGTGDGDDDFPSVHDGTDSDGQSHLGDFRDIVVEEAGIGDDGIVGLLSAWVSGVGKTSVLMRVREVKLLPGSLKAICPSGPIPDVNENVFGFMVPPRKSSIPPTLRISSSYFTHSSSRSTAFPSRI